MQTPDFGAFELDDRGELVVPILRRHLDSAVAGESAFEPAPAVTVAIPPGPPDAVGVVKHAGTSDVVDAAMEPSLPAVVDVVVKRRSVDAAEVAAPSSPPGAVVVADWRAEPSRAAHAARDTVSFERFLDGDERKRLLDGLLRDGIDDNAVLERDRTRQVESKVAHGRAQRITFSEVLQAPVNRLIFWACLGLFVPLVGPVVIAYANLRFRNAPAGSRRGLRAAEWLGAIGTVTSLCIALVIAASRYG
jgi:hypothetical protein